MFCCWVDRIKCLCLTKKYGIAPASSAIAAAAAKSAASSSLAFPVAPVRGLLVVGKVGTSMVVKVNYYNLTVCSIGTIGLGFVSQDQEIVLL